MQITVRHGGDLVAAMQKSSLAFKAAATAAMKAAAETLKNRLRADVLGAGLGQGVANAWRFDELYPQDGLSASPAAKVRTKAPKIIHAFDRGVEIRAKGGRWLPIPLPAAGRGSGNKKLTPKRFLEAHPGVRLRFVRVGRSARIQLGSARRGPPRAWRYSAMLVAEGARLSDLRFGANLNRKGVGGIAAGREGHAVLRKRKGPTGGASIPVFALVRLARLSKRLDVEARADEAQAHLAGVLIVELDHQKLV